MDRIIMHIDLDYFYAACEVSRNPGLASKPVIVCVFSGRTQESGAVATCNYVARGLGIRSGMPISQAKGLAAGNKDAAFLPADMDFYRSTSDRIMEILESHADSFEQVSVDEAYLDVSRRCADVASAAGLGKELKGEILGGEDLTCSVGIGPNKLLAKIAAGIRKPDGLSIIRLEDIKQTLWAQPVGKLFSIGPKTEETLAALAITTIGELASVEVRRLIAEFGENRARQLHEFANGIDGREVEQSTRQQIARIATLKENTRDLGKLVDFIDYLASLLHEKLKKDGRFFRNIAIIAIATDLKLHTRSKTLEVATADIEMVKTEAKMLMDAFLKENPEVILRRAGLRVSSFVDDQKPPIGQKSLGDFGK